MIWSQYVDGAADIVWFVCVFGSLARVSVRQHAPIPDAADRVISACTEKVRVGWVEVDGIDTHDPETAATSSGLADTN